METDPHDLLDALIANPEAVVPTLTPATWRAMLTVDALTLIHAHPHADQAIGDAMGHAGRTDLVDVLIEVGLPVPPTPAPEIALAARHKNLQHLHTANPKDRPPFGHTVWKILRSAQVNSPTLAAMDAIHAQTGPLTLEGLQHDYETALVRAAHQQRRPVVAELLERIDDPHRATAYNTLATLWLPGGIPALGLLLAIDPRPTNVGLLLAKHWLYVNPSSAEALQVLWPRTTFAQVEAAMTHLTSEGPSVQGDAALEALAALGTRPEQEGLVACYGDRLPNARARLRAAERSDALAIVTEAAPSSRRPRHRA